ncbi:hypothetical protein M9H77_30704 [Catharanthus roseus]|uniref:Uncharacterized protein n=1 Tax=Catharanthus roseus TaxID=4058 RepID=A0ACB9ZY18_CATRO|nr:hypothetical protein M9H77_30704 [Catharanthus roseus]
MLVLRSDFARMGKNSVPFSSIQIDESDPESLSFWADEDPNTFEEFLEPDEFMDFRHLFTTDRIFSSKDELGEQIAISENLQLFVHNGRHNHKIVVYHHGHGQATRLTEEQLQQTEQFRKSHVPPRNILRFFREQDVGCAVSAQKIYNVVAKIKKNRIQGRNTVEEVLCLSA